MIRITKDLNAEMVEIGDPKRTEEIPYKRFFKIVATFFYTNKWS